MSRIADLFSIWTTTRAAGLTSYLLLFLSTAAGITMSLKMLGGRAKPVLLAVHQSTGWFGFLFGFIHGAVLLFDDYVGYSAWELLVPFASHSHRVPTGFGTLAFYCTLLLILSSDFMKKLGKKTWRLIHFLAFPAFFLGLTHGLMLGTDAQEPWARAMYIVTGTLICVMTVLRVAAVRFEKKPVPAKTRPIRSHP